MQKIKKNLNTLPRFGKPIELKQPSVKLKLATKK